MLYLCMKKSKKEKIPTIFIAIIILLVVLSGVSVYSSIVGNSEYFSFNGVTLSNNDYKAIQDNFGDDPLVRVCNLDNKNCIVLVNIDKFKK